MLNETIKEKLTVFSIFFGIIIGTTVILVTAILLSRSSWKTNLAADVQQVLNTYSKDTYTVNKYIQTDYLLSTSSAAYSVIKKGQKQNESYYGIIVRIPSILGPVPAVFLYSENTGTTFAGYAINIGKADVAVNLKNTNGTLQYWEKIIPKLLAKSIAKAKTKTNARQDKRNGR